MRLDAREHVERSRGAIALVEKAQPPQPQPQPQLPERREKQVAVKIDPDTDETATGGLFVPLVGGEERDTVTEVAAEIGNRRSGQEQDGGSGTAAVAEPAPGDVGSGQAPSPPSPSSSSVQVARMVGGDVQGEFNLSHSPTQISFEFPFFPPYFLCHFFKTSPNTQSCFAGQRGTLFNEIPPPKYPPNATRIWIVLVKCPVDPLVPLTRKTEYIIFRKILILSRLL